MWGTAGSPGRTYLQGYLHPDSSHTHWIRLKTWEWRQLRGDAARPRPPAAAPGGRGQRTSARPHRTPGRPDPRGTGRRRPPARPLPKRAWPWLHSRRAPRQPQRESAAGEGLRAPAPYLAKSAVERQAPLFKHLRPAARHRAGPGPAEPLRESGCAAARRHRPCAQRPARPRPGWACPRPREISWPMGRVSVLFAGHGCDTRLCSRVYVAKVKRVPEMPAVSS